MWAFTLLIMAALDLFMGWRAGQYDHQILALHGTLVRRTIMAFAFWPSQ